MSAMDKWLKIIDADISPKWEECWFNEAARERLRREFRVAKECPVNIVNADKYIFWNLLKWLWYIIS